MQNINDQLNTIVNLFNNGEKQKALNEINVLLSNNKKNIDLLLLHAKICINLDEIDKANSSLKKILNLDLNNYDALKLIYVNYLKINKSNDSGWGSSVSDSDNEDPMGCFYLVVGVAILIWLLYF